MTRAGHDLRLLTAACLAWAVLAAALAVHASPAFMALVAAVALVAGLGAARLTGAARVVALAAVVTALMSGTAAARVHLEDRGPVKRFAVERAVAQLEVRVAGEPRRLPDSGLPGQDGTRYLVPAVIERIEARGTRTTVRTPCVLVDPIGRKSGDAGHKAGRAEDSRITMSSPARRGRSGRSVSPCKLR